MAYKREEKRGWHPQAAFCPLPSLFSLLPSLDGERHILSPQNAKNPKRHVRKLLVAAAVSLGILALLFWKVGIRVDRVFAGLRRVDLFWLGLTFAISAAIHILAGAHKWYLILRGMGCDTTYGETLFVRMGTDPIRFVMPFKSGELSNILYFSRTGKLPLAESASWVLFDKALNIAGTFFWLIVGLAATTVAAKDFPWIGLIAGTILLLPLVSGHVRRLGAALATRMHAKLGRLANALLTTFERISMRRKVGLLLYGMAFQLRPILVCYLLIVAFGGQFRTRPAAPEMLASGAVVMIASNVPLTQWGTGPREVALWTQFKGHLASPESREVLISIGILMAIAIHVVPAVIGLPLLGSLIGAISNGKTGGRGLGGGVRNTALRSSASLRSTTSDPRSPFRVLLINPRATYVNEIAQKCYPPMNLLYLATALRGAGIGVKIVDANAVKMWDEELAETCREYDPGLIGVPIYTEIQASVHRMMTALHAADPSARFVFGGPHASALPEDTLDRFQMVDFILRGEAEHSLVKLCEALQGRMPLDQVPGLVRRGDDGHIETPQQKANKDLDKLGFPARDLVADVYEKKKYYSLLVRHKPVDTLVTSRGCPFACNFCYNQNHTYRCRSTDHVMEEILSVLDRGIRDIEFLDDTFTFRREHAMAVFNAVIREKLPISFRIKSRVDVVDEELLATAKKAGVYLVAYGTESGDEEMLQRMNKRTTAAENERAIRLTKQAGIQCHTSWIFGYPGETPESIQNTINMIVRTKPTTAQIAMLRPYPQTVVYREAQDAGTLMGEWSVESDAYPWVKLPWTETRADLEQYVQKAMRRVYYRPYYIYSFAKMVFGGANTTLARYALQEAGKTLRYLLHRAKAERAGSV